MPACLPYAQGFRLGRGAIALRFRHQPLPSTSQRLLHAQHGRKQEVYRASLDFLNRARVKIHKFSKMLLRKRLRHPLTPDVCAKLFQLARLIAI